MNMNNCFELEVIKNVLSGEELLTGNFGLERESLRIKSNGTLALSKHPAQFGDKLKNPVITTDFSESQVEMVTPTFSTTQETYDFLLFLTDYVNSTINDDEYLWNQSLPCILPDADKIPIAEYGTDEYSVKSRQYRVELARKYGTKKQLISGIHYNFSFDENTIKKLYEHSNKSLTYKEYKNSVYLKIIRNYLRYKWFIIYITGCSVASHESFSEDCIELMDNKVNDEYYSTDGISFRNASSGYKNLLKLYPRYDTVSNFISDVTSYINEGKLSEAKELYTQIRMKSKNPNDFLNSLEEEGILYIEIRTVDINSFDICGISKKELDFLHLFIIFLLIVDESDYEKWQEESLINEETTAEFGHKSGFKLIKDGIEIPIEDWANEIISIMNSINSELKLGFDEVINEVTKRFIDKNNTYSRQLLKLVTKEGFIKSQINIAKNNKQISKNRFEKGIYDNDYFNKYQKSF